MKQGWTYKKLGEVCDFEGGSQPPKSEWISNPKDGYVRMLQIRDFTKSRNAEIEYVKVTKKLRLCKADDILIGRYGASVGKILTGLAGAYNVAIIKSIPNEELIRKDFIRRYFESSLFQSILFKVCTSRAAQAGFSKDDIKDELIPLPPLSEQQRIVKRLDSAFAHIDELIANAEKHVNEARALFQKALSKAMEPKEGWEEKTLGGCFVSINNGANIKQIKGAKGIPITRIETLSNDKFNRERMGYANVFDSSPYSSYILNDCDILMSHINSMKFLGRAVQYTKIENEIILHGMNLLRLVPTKEVLSSFLIYQFYTAFFRNQIISISHQSVNQASFNTTNLKGLYLLVPPLSEQQRIVERLDSLSENVKALEENQRKVMAECDALKQALLRKVFE